MFWTSLAGYETSFGLVSLLFPDVRCICIFFLFFLSGSGGSSAPLGDNVQLRENRRGNADRAALAAQRKWRSKVAGSRRITGFIKKCCPRSLPLEIICAVGIPRCNASQLGLGNIRSNQANTVFTCIITHVN